MLGTPYEAFSTPPRGAFAIARFLRYLLTAYSLVVLVPDARPCWAEVSARVADTIDESTPVEVPEPSPLAVEYHRTGVRLWLFSRCWLVLVPLMILVTGTSARLRLLAERIARSGFGIGILLSKFRASVSPHTQNSGLREPSRLTWFGTIVVYVALFLLVDFIADLPLKYYSGFVRNMPTGCPINPSRSGSATRASYWRSISSAARVSPGCRSG